MSVKYYVYVAFALLAFAGNSLLCRAALSESSIDAASFTAIRLVSGAIVLLVIVHINKPAIPLKGSAVGALALFLYAVGFSFAYINMDAGVGALILFGSVQVTMIWYGLMHGESMSMWRWTGLLLAILGLVILLLPSASAPPIQSALLMVVAGVAWGIYSLVGRGTTSPLSMTAGNFVYTVPMVIGLIWLFSTTLSIDKKGITLAIASGAICSGLGYSVWYKVLPKLQSTNAATIQLSVPVLAMILGFLLLNERITMMMLLASFAIISGIAMVVKREVKSS